MTCFFAAFQNTNDIARGQFLHQYCPTAGPHLAACAFNIYGDANAIFRTEHLRSVGGFVADRSTYCHDWETFVKLVQAGRRIGVVPDYLFYYRRRADGMAAVMTDKGANTYPFIQRMITSFVAGNVAGSKPSEPRMLWEALASYFLRDDLNQAARPRPRYGAARRLAAAWKAASGKGPFHAERRLKQQPFEVVLPARCKRPRPPQSARPPGRGPCPAKCRRSHS